MKYKEQRNNQTGEVRWVPVGEPTSQVSAPEREEARIGPLLANLLKSSATAKYFGEAVPEYYQGLQSDVQEKGLEHFLTPKGYAEGLGKQLGLAPKALAAAGEIAPFVAPAVGTLKGLGLQTLPQKFLPRVGQAAIRGGMLPFFHGAAAISPEEQQAEAEGRPVELPQAGIERLLKGGIEGSVGAAVGGTIGAVTGLKGLLKGGQALPGSRAALGEAKAEAFRKVPGKAPANLVAKSGDKFAARTPQVQKLHERYKAVLEVPEGMDWTEFGESVSDWGSFGHAKDSALKGTPTGRYFADLYRAGKDVIEANAPEAAKLIKIESLTYKIPRLVNRWTWQLLKYRGLGRVFGI